MMDLGATICTPKIRLALFAPGTNVAPRTRAAMRRRFRAGYRNAKERCAAARLSLRSGRTASFLVRTRPANGLLGGMTEVPTTEWVQNFDDRKALEGAPHFFSNRSRLRIAWRRIAGVVRHVFTHFPLELTVYVAELPKGTRAPAGMRWVALEKLAGEALPSVMHKVVAHALEK